MPCDLERERKKRERVSKRERFPSSPLALFMRAAGALMALIHEWKGERKEEQKRGVCIVSHSGNYLPAHCSHSTSLYYIWPIQV